MGSSAGVATATPVVVAAEASAADWVEAAGTWAAAIFTGLALIFAFRGWRAANHTLDLERQALELERARSDAERGQRSAERLEVLRLAEIEADRLRVGAPHRYQAAWTEPKGQTATLVEMINESFEPFKAVTVEFFADREDDEAQAREHRPLLRAGEEWRPEQVGEFPHCVVRYTDTAGRTWRKVAGVEGLPDLAV